MVLQRKLTREGTQELIGKFPKKHQFSSEMFTELALTGVATMGRDPETEEDYILLTFDNASAVYRITSRPGEVSDHVDENGETDEKTAWTLVLVRVESEPGDEPEKRTSKKKGGGK